MFQQILTIGRNTFTESIRQPIFVVLTLVATLMLILNPQLAAYTLDDDNKLLVDLGLSTLFIAGLLLAAFTATGVLSAEVENKTVLTVVSKPVARPIFVIGKYLGVSTAIGLAYWTLMLIFLMTVRHKVMQTASDKFDMPVIVFSLLAGLGALGFATLANYFYHWVFTSTFMQTLFTLMTFAWLLVLVIGKSWEFQSPATEIDGQLMIGLLLIFMAVMLLGAVAIAASTRLGQIMTLLVCIGVFLFGLICDYLLGSWADRSTIVAVLYRCAPNLQFLWPADALTQENDFTLSYVGIVMAYTVLMIGALLSLAISLFQTREVG